MSSIAAPAEPLVEFSTGTVPPRERVDYWRTVLRRLKPEFVLSEDRPFDARMVRLKGSAEELVRHTGDGMLSIRNLQDVGRDDCDDISIGFLLAGTSAHADQGSRTLKAGDIHVIDCARPVQMKLSRHRTMSLILRRERAREVLGTDPSAAAHLRLPRAGMGSVLRSHLQTVFDEAPHLTPEHCAVALRVAAEMAGVAIQAALERPVEAERYPLGLYQAALALIRNRCVDPEFTPPDLAAALGCSRAALYRLFAAQDSSVSALIWAERVEHAHRLLTSAALAALPINEIAFRSGFIDHATFDRMFKRRYGMPPRDARLLARAAQAGSGWQ